MARINARTMSPRQVADVLSSRHGLRSALRIAQSRCDSAEDPRVASTYWRATDELERRLFSSPASLECRVCGGAGWTDGSAELRECPDTTCVGCGGSGQEPK